VADAREHGAALGITAAAQLPLPLQLDTSDRAGQAHRATVGPALGRAPRGPGAGTVELRSDGSLRTWNIFTTPRRRRRQVQLETPSLASG